MTITGEGFDKENTVVTFSGNSGEVCDLVVWFNIIVSYATTIKWFHINI